MHKKNRIGIWIINVLILIATILLIWIFSSCFQESYSLVIKIILIILCVLVIVLSLIYLSNLNENMNENDYLDFLKVLIMKKNESIEKITIDKNGIIKSYEKKNNEITIKEERKDK